MTLGEKIAMLRKQKGMSQADLAAIIGTSKQAVGKYEKGIVDNLPLNRVQQLASVLDTTPAYLMGWEEEEKAASTDDLILELFRQLSDDDKREILSFIRYKLSQREG